MVLNSVLYILMSALESFSSLYLILLIFRIELRFYRIELIISILLLAISNYFFQQQTVFSNIIPLLTMILFFVLFTFMFRISLIHSMFMTIFGFLTVFLIQGLIVLLATFPPLNLTLQEAQSVDSIRYTMQTFSSMIYLFIGYRCSKRGFVFTFVPYTPALGFKLTFKNISILLVFVISILTVVIAFNSPNMLLAIVLLLILFSAAIYMGIVREVTHF